MYRAYVVRVYKSLIRPLSPISRNLHKLPRLSRISLQGNKVIHISPLLTPSHSLCHSILSRHHGQMPWTSTNRGPPGHGYELDLSTPISGGEEKGNLLLKHMLKYALLQNKYVNPPPVAKFPFNQLTSATALSLPI